MNATEPNIGRWLARFLDPSIERQYRQHALPGQRKRAMVIVAVLILVPSFNLAHEIPRFLHGDTAISLIFLMRLASVTISLTLLIFMLKARSQALIENLLGAYGLYVVLLSYFIMAYHPGDPAIAPVSAVGVTAFVYFFSPLQLPRIILLGVVASVAGWVACAVIRPLSPETAFRLALWLLALNTVGYVGVNILHRTLRELFWERRLLAEQKGEIEAAFERERTAFRQFKQFAELISHEFRNPLAVVKSKAQLLQLISEMGAPADLDALPAIERAVDRLDSLFCQWLAGDRLAEGDILVTSRPVSVAEIFHWTAAVAPASPQHPITFEAGGESLRLLADPDLIQAVLSNLIDNGVKYSPNGGEIIVRAKRENDAIVFSVQDHGIGIAPDQVHRVSDKYFRVSHDGPVRGFGLGLFLVHRIVEAHGGAVAIESVLGEGTTVFVRLPTEQNTLADKTTVSD